MACGRQRSIEPIVTRSSTFELDAGSASQRSVHLAGLYSPVRCSGSRTQVRSLPVPLHRYFICLGNGTPPIPWDLDDEAQLARFDCVYFGRVFRAMERHARAGALTVYMTWDLRELPSYGDDVVAVVLGDENSRIPTYVGRVRAVFKCYGIRPFAGAHPLRDRTWLSVLIWLQGVRRRVRHIPDDVRMTLRRLSRRYVAPTVHIPLGYYNQLDLPPTPFAERTTSVFFAGSLERRPRSRLSPRHWIRMPKPRAREEMLAALGAFRRRRPTEPVHVRLTSTFASTTRADAEAYSRDLMNTRICLVPRGASAETFRFFEALRYGCVVVCERLPPTPFYAGSPAVVIDRWSGLPDVLTRLLDDRAGLQARHERSLEWWHERCSEEVVGAIMAARIDAALG